MLEVALFRIRIQEFLKHLELLDKAFLLSLAHYYYYYTIYIAPISRIESYLCTK